MWCVSLPWVPLFPELCPHQNPSKAIWPFPTQMAILGHFLVHFGPPPNLGRLAGHQTIPAPMVDLSLDFKTVHTPGPISQGPRTPGEVKDSLSLREKNAPPSHSKILQVPENLGMDSPPTCWRVGGRFGAGLDGYP